MRLAKTGQIHNVCQPNALLTLKEFVLDYGDENITKIAEETIRKGLEEIPNEEARKATKEKLDRIEKGERDLRF